jgi:hypothetical protein
MKTFLLWLFVGASALAQTPVLSLELNTNGEPFSRGSIVAVDIEAENPDDGFAALTAAHVVVKTIKYDPKVGYSYTFHPPTTNYEVYIDSEWVPASVRNVSKEGDVALLTIKTDKKVPRLKIGEARPEVLKPVVMSGYVLGVDFEQFTGIAISSNAGDSDTIYSPEHRVIPGQSGGAVTDSDGRLIGIISSYTGNEPWVINYTPVTEINRFLTASWDKKIVAGTVSPGTVRRVSRAFPRITTKRAKDLNFKAPSEP